MKTFSNTTSSALRQSRFSSKFGSLCRLGLGMSALLLFSSGSVMAQRIKVVIDGVQVKFDGMGPVQTAGHTLVPVRGVLEQLGAEVEWRPGPQVVVASTGTKSIRLHLGDTEATVNGKQVPLDAPAQAFSGHTMVPLRFISEALGYDVRWDDAARTVIIVTAERQNRDRPNRARHEGDEPDPRDPRGRDRRLRNPDPKPDPKQ